MDIPTSNFFDVITANLLVPHIIIPTRITSTTRTLSGNLTLAISDHLAQFLIIQEEAYKTPLTIYTRDFKHFDRVNVLLDILAIDWNKVISIENHNPDESFNSCFNKIDSLVNS